MTAEDWVRLLNLLGSIVLFIGSFRGQQWTQRQASIEDRAAAASDRTATPTRGTSGGQSEATTLGEFDREAADIVSRPYFDRPAYLLFCAGFAISTIATAIDMQSHDTFRHLVGLTDKSSSHCSKSRDLPSAQNAQLKCPGG
jgi:hypothetical protein